MDPLQLDGEQGIMIFCQIIGAVGVGTLATRQRSAEICIYRFRQKNTYR